MCFGSPKPPPPPVPPQIQKPAEIEEGLGVKGAKLRRNQLLIRKRTSISGVAPTSSAV